VSKSVSVVIPNYNGAHLLQKNLPSVIRALDFIQVEYEIIVVDDCSKDDSVLFIQTNYPAIKLIRNEKNGGFSISCNRGIELADKELILLLNTDIELTENYFEGQFKYFEKDDTFGVMGKISGAKYGEVQDTARYITQSGFKIKANNFYYVEDPDFWTPTAYLSGANALVDSKKIKAIGGFNELFSPFYCEDFELGLRAWRLGWKCFYHHASYCMHEQSATTKNFKTKNWVKSILFRNRLFVHSIHLEKKDRIFWGLQIIFFDCMFLWIGFKFYFYKSVYLFLCSRTQLKKSRTEMGILMKKYHSSRSVEDVAQEINGLMKEAGQNVVFI